MAHQIESMFFIGQTPWHGLGKQLEQAPSIREAIVAAGLDWSVELTDIYMKHPGSNHPAVWPQISTATLPHDVKVPAKALVRSTDQSILGVVGERYRPLQNIDAFDFFQPFVENGFVDLETAGSLQSGKRIWVLARIKENSDIGIVGDDAIRKFIMLSNSHDGTMAIRVGFTPVRIVCANTLAQAHGATNSQLLRVRHTATAKASLEDIREAMNLANQTFEATAEQYRAMASKQINAADLRNYVKIVLGQEHVADKDLSTRADNQVAEIVQLFEYGRGQQLTGVKGTVWAAYNAVTEYLTHEAGPDADKRYNSLWFGQGATRNQLAFNEAMKLVAA